MSKSDKIFCSVLLILYLIPSILLFLGGQPIFDLSAQIAFIAYTDWVDLYLSELAVLFSVLLFFKTKIIWLKLLAVLAILLPSFCLYIYFQVRYFSH